MIEVIRIYLAVVAVLSQISFEVTIKDQHSFVHLAVEEAVVNVVSVVRSEIAVEFERAVIELESVSWIEPHVNVTVSPYSLNRILINYHFTNSDVL